MPVTVEGHGPDDAARIGQISGGIRPERHLPEEIFAVQRLIIKGLRRGRTECQNRCPNYLPPPRLSYHAGIVNPCPGHFSRTRRFTNKK